MGWNHLEVFAATKILVATAPEFLYQVDSEGE
jgi:hypothetical protein